MSDALMEVSEVERAVALPQKPAKRAVLTDAIKACLKLVRAQGRDRKKAFRYAKAMCDNERELGKSLSELPRGVAGKRPKRNSGQNDHYFMQRLADAGIDYERAKRAQRMWRVPVETYQQWLKELEADESRELPAFAGVLALYGDPAVSKNTGETEWYTPAKYIESARAVMGSIDLDPASSKAANKTVRATHFYTAKDDGLQQGWSGNVWLNPPFSMLLDFAEKVVNELPEIDQLIMLGPNFSDSQWWQICAEYASLICHTNHRIRFVSARTRATKGESPTNGHTFFYFGNAKDSFGEEFQQWGIVR